MRFLIFWGNVGSSAVPWTKFSVAVSQRKRSLLRYLLRDSRNAPPHCSDDRFCKTDPFQCLFVFNLQRMVELQMFHQEKHWKSVLKYWSSIAIFSAQYKRNRCTWRHWYRRRARESTRRFLFRRSVNSGPEFLVMWWGFSAARRGNITKRAQCISEHTVLEPCTCIDIYSK